MEQEEQAAAQQLEQLEQPEHLLFLPEGHQKQRVEPHPQAVRAVRPRPVDGVVRAEELPVDAAALQLRQIPAI